MSSSKIISDDSKSAYEKWELPDVKHPEEQRSGFTTAGELETLQKQAYDEGFAEGHKEGLAAGHAELEAKLQAKIHQFETIIQFLNKPLQDIDEELTGQMAEVSITIARQLIRRELRTDPGQVVAVVREALSALPGGADKVRIYLHPEDAQLTREAFSLNEESEQSLHIIDDPILSRGGCRVETENSKIDATLENRLNRIIAASLGGERGDDNATD